MGDSNTPINAGVSVHHHTQASSQGGALVITGTNQTQMQIASSGKYMPLEALV
tara:strand:- start:350 stop:508 length:159 start_codon:yes stop_codon:yes gene_type:complete